MKYVLAFTMFLLCTLAHGQVPTDVIFADDFDIGPASIASYTGPNVNLVHDQATYNKVYQFDYINKTDRTITLNSVKLSIIRPNLQVSNPFINQPVLVQILDSAGAIAGTVPTSSTLVTSVVPPYYDVTFNGGAGYDVPPGATVHLLVSALAKTISIPPGAPRTFQFTTGATDTTAFYNDNGVLAEQVVFQGAPTFGWTLFYP